MAKELIVSSSAFEKKIAILEDDLVTEIFVEREQSRSIHGNVYKGRVTRVLPGMQAAFVDIGLERNAFLYVTDFFEEYGEYAEIFKTSETGGSEGEEGERERTSPEDRRPKRSRRGRRDRSRRDETERTEEGSTEVLTHEPLVLPDVLDAEDEPIAAIPDELKEPEVVPAPVPTPAPPAEPRTPTLSFPARIVIEPKILPETLEISSTLASMEWPSDDDATEQPNILPAVLDGTIQESKRPRSRSRRGGSSRRARHTSKPSIQEFSLGRGGTSKNRRRSGGYGPPLIADMLKEGQEILVQVSKEPLGKKGARITSHIVLPGRFLVFMPTVNHVGVSRRIESARERQRLRETILELRGDVERGFIVRTAGEGRSQAELRQDMVYLTRLWEQMRTKADRSSAPALLHSELDVVQKVIRDFLTDDYRAIRVDDEEEYERIIDFINNFSPNFVNRVRLHHKSNPIFDEFNVTAEIEKALKSKVWLKSGGYIVIHQTEALVAIDVNTGKYVGRTNSLEDTIAKTNMDAVREVVRQIRLRDLGGIIIIDFIDMVDPRNQSRVMEALQNELRNDKSPSKVLPFNDFGLVAITRKRVKQSLERSLCQPCENCEGTGMTKSVRTICYSLYDEVKRNLSSYGDGTELLIRCHPEVGQALRSSESRVLKELQELLKKEVTVLTDPLLSLERFDLIES